MEYSWKEYGTTTLRIPYSTIPYSVSIPSANSTTTKEWTTSAKPLSWEPNQMYLDELQHFLNCLGGQEKPTLDLSEAARVLEIALAAKKSALTGQIVNL